MEAIGKYAAYKSRNEVITGAWRYTGQVAFGANYTPDATHYLVTDAGDPFQHFETKPSVGISFVAVTTAKDSGNSIPINKPAGVTTGDVLIAIVATNDDTAVTWPSGFTQIMLNGQGAGTAPQLATAYKVATASEPTSYTISLGNVRNFVAALSAYRGCDTSGSPVDANDGNTQVNTTTPSTVSINTSRSSALVLTTFVNVTTGGTVGSMFTPPSGETERVDTGANNVNLGVSDEIKTSVGATGVKTCTVGGSPTLGDEQPNQIMALLPESGTGSWSWGIDRSTGGQMKLSLSTVLGTNDVLVVDTLGNITLTSIVQTISAQQQVFRVKPAAITVVTNVSAQGFSYFDAPVLSINGGITVTNAATVYIAGAPSNTGSGTLSNAWSLWSVGAIRVDARMDLSNIVAGNPVFKITATSDIPTATWGGAAGNQVSTTPAGWLEILVGASSRYIPFWA